MHVQKLFRLTDEVVFCFDGDNAGRKAAWRALENALPALADGKNARFLFLPEGEDPDNFVRKRGKAAFEAALGGAVPLSEFLLRELAARASAHERGGPRRAGRRGEAATSRRSPRPCSPRCCAGAWPNSPGCRKRSSSTCCGPRPARSRIAAHRGADRRARIARPVRGARRRWPAN